MKKILFSSFLNVYCCFGPCELMRKHAFSGRNTQQLILFSYNLFVNKERWQYICFTHCYLSDRVVLSTEQKARNVCYSLICLNYMWKNNKWFLKLNWNYGRTNKISIFLLIIFPTLQCSPSHRIMWFPMLFWHFLFFIHYFENSKRLLGLRNNHLTNSTWPNEYDRKICTWPKRSHLRTLTF